MQDVTRKLDSEALSSEELEDISKVILQDNHKSVQKMQKEFDKIVDDKDKENSRIRNHKSKITVTNTKDNG